MATAQEVIDDLASLIDSGRIKASTEVLVRDPGVSESAVLLGSDGHGYGDLMMEVDRSGPGVVRVLITVREDW